MTCPNYISSETWHHLCISNSCYDVI